MREALSDLFHYILSTFQTIYFIPENCTISYGKPEGDIVIANHSSAFFQEKNPQPSSDTITWKKWNETEIPFIHEGVKEEKIISFENQQSTINYDIIGSAFFFLSGWQEYHSNVRDQYGRYPYNESFQYRHQILEIPVVNYYFDILKTAIEKLTQTQLKRKLWPHNELAVFLSHDIDKINSGWKEDSFAALKNGKIPTSIRLALSKISGKDPWENLNSILRSEQELGVISTWFFIIRKGGNNADYKLRQVMPYFKSIKNSNSEIAIHGSLGSAQDSKKLQNEINTLDMPIYGNRFHFLCFEPKAYGNTIEKSSLEYDSSQGFAEHIGFRNGFCYPFKPYNLHTLSAHNFIEIPLIIMDTTLCDKKYMGNDTLKFKTVEKVISEVKKFNGLLSVLWHNNYFTSFKYEGWGERYISLVNELKKSDSQFFTGQQISEMLNE